MLKYLLVLVILRLGAVDARLLCGIEMITSNMMEIQIKLDCSSLLGTLILTEKEYSCLT